MAASIVIHNEQKHATRTESVAKGMSNVVNVSGITAMHLQGVQTSQLKWPTLFHLPQPHYDIGMYSWNFVNGISCMLVGLSLVLRDDPVNSTDNKIKGGVYITSAAAILGCTYNPVLAAALGATTAGMVGPVFLISEFAAFVDALIDFKKSARELKYDTWLRDKKKEIAILTRKNQPKYASLLQTIEKEVEVRQRIHAFDQKPHPEGVVLETPSADDREIEVEIKAQLIANHRKNTFRLTQKSISFVGWALLVAAPFVASVCPPAGVILFGVGLCLVSFAALGVMYHWGQKLVSEAKPVLNNAVTFFSTLNKQIKTNSEPCPTHGQYV
jgi:hypothetical protein